MRKATQPLPFPILPVLTTSTATVQTVSPALPFDAGSNDVAGVVSIAFNNSSTADSSLNGPASANGLAADLYAYVGQTVSVTFAAVPKTDTDSLCIVAHITGIKVAE